MNLDWAKPCKDGGMIQRAEKLADRMEAAALRIETALAKLEKLESK